jgi:hypothetical protein
MKSAPEIITPQMAKKYLEKNTNNRTVRPSTVKRYANDMKNGNWQFTDQGISFHEDGSLANGQHRLLAIIESNTPTKMYVTRGVPNGSRIFDRGASRSAADTLTISGFGGEIANNNLLAGVNFLFNYSKGRAPTDTMIARFCSENHDLIVKATELTTSGSGKDKPARKAPVVAAAFCALFCGIDEDGLRDFFSAVNTGFIDGREQSAAIVLRNYLTMKYGRASSDEKKYLFMATTQAISDFTKGRSRTKSYPANTKPVFYRYVKAELLDDYQMS